MRTRAANSKEADSFLSLRSPAATAQVVGTAEGTEETWSSDLEEAAAEAAWPGGDLTAASSSQGIVSGWRGLQRRWKALLGCAGLAVFGGAACIWLASSTGTRSFQRGTGDLELWVPNDMWGVHDLLLVGFTGVFMRLQSSGMAEVHAAAFGLAEMLPKLHPHAPCREALRWDSPAAVPGGGEAKAAQWTEQSLLKVADTSWSCLPGAFQVSKFDKSFSEHEMHDAEAAHEARMPRLIDDTFLGVCSGSNWPRTCSYWASMHALAYRADSLGLGAALLKHLLPILAGGATMCGGCTLHFRSLSDPALSPAVRADYGTMY
eukprot:TRINITY_DN112259_c0_g1_i1.p1 TRINITY_DN112259_c0_g1~~TRINITY_DN112259_c0_g1_i1.p1  ORF type:complete len:319 (+),score=61.31 TRINITY_DN112259_c0_g1_i1:115-1071(+)